MISHYRVLLSKNFLESTFSFLGDSRIIERDFANNSATVAPACLVDILVIWRNWCWNWEKKLFPEEPELDGCSSVKMIFKTEISFVLGLIEL